MISTLTKYNPKMINICLRIRREDSTVNRKYITEISTCEPKTVHLIKLPTEVHIPNGQYIKYMLTKIVYRSF